MLTRGRRLRLVACHAASSVWMPPRTRTSMSWRLRLDAVLPTLCAPPSSIISTLPAEFGHPRQWGQTNGSPPRTRGEPLSSPYSDGVGGLEGCPFGSLEVAVDPSGPVGVITGVVLLAPVAAHEESRVEAASCLVAVGDGLGAQGSQVDDCHW